MNKFRWVYAIKYHGINKYANKFINKKGSSLYPFWILRSSLIYCLSIYVHIICIVLYSTYLIVTVYFNF